jgi:acyl carrier protein
MDEATVQLLICTYLSERFKVAPERLTSGARFQEDLGLDSLEVTELLITIEDETMADLGLSQLATIDEVASIGALAVAVSRAASASPGTTKETRNS